MSASTPSSGTAELSGKVALVTGGAGGLGSAAARALARARAEEGVRHVNEDRAERAGGGAEVVIADVNEAGEEVAEEIGGLFVAIDVSTLEANRDLVDVVRREH